MVSMSGDTQSAVRVAPCSASVFGTISPSTMWRYVSTAMATTLATVCAVIHPARLNGPDHVSIHPATTCSPYMPRPRLASDTPIWVVAMYLSRRSTLSRIATTRWAPRFPFAARCSRLARGAPTIANSAATKSPFAITNRRMSARVKKTALTLRPRSMALP